MPRSVNRRVELVRTLRRVTMDEPEDDLGLVPWGLKRHPDGAASTEVMASALAQDKQGQDPRTPRESGGPRSGPRGSADWWKLTGSGSLIAEGRVGFPS